LINEFKFLGVIYNFSEDNLRSSTRKGTSLLLEISRIVIDKYISPKGYKLLSKIVNNIYELNLLNSNLSKFLINYLNNGKLHFPSKHFDFKHLITESLSSRLCYLSHFGNINLPEI
jgi:hypothetical protein